MCVCVPHLCSLLLIGEKGKQSQASGNPPVALRESTNIKERFVSAAESSSFGGVRCVRGAAPRLQAGEPTRPPDQAAD